MAGNADDVGDGPAGPPSMEARRAALEALVRERGRQRDEQKEEEREAALEQQEAYASGDSDMPAPPRDNGFSADCILTEENGFELWLGSLEDALCLEALKHRQINALMNCAYESCLAEIACFRHRPARSGRPRTHTRGASLSDEAFGQHVGSASLNREQVMAVVSFEGSWYTQELGREVAYCSINAYDEDGYRLCEHFPQMMQFLAECRKEGRKVLVHCVMGINRAATAVTAFLCECCGHNLEDAVVVASTRRGYILSNQSFLEQLIECYGQVEKDAPAVGILGPKGTGSTIERAGEVKVLVNDAAPHRQSAGL